MSSAGGSLACTLSAEDDWATAQAVLRDLISSWNTEGHRERDAQFRCGSEAFVALIDALSSSANVAQHYAPGASPEPLFHATPVVLDSQLDPRSITLEAKPR